MKQTSFVNLLAGNIIYRCLNILLNILITLLLTRLLSTEGFGVLSLLVANVAIFNLITCLGVDAGLTYHYSSRDMPASKLFSILYTVILVQLAGLGLIEWIHHNITGKYWLLNETGPEILLWGIGYFLAIIIIDKYIAVLNGAHLYTLANKTLFIANLIGLAILGWAFYFHQNLSALFYLKLFIIGTVVQALFLFISFHLIAGRRLVLAKLRPADWKNFFTYSFIAYISNMIQFLAYRVDYWIVDYYHGEAEVGLYSLAVKLGQMLWVLPLLFASIILPLVADKENKVGAQQIFSLIRVSNTLLVGITLIAALMAGWFIPLFAGEAYQQSVIPFLYLLPGLLLFCINIMLAAYFAGKGMLKINLVGSSICLLVVVMMDFILIPSYGIIGAAIASSLGYTTSAIYLIARFLTLTNAPLNDISWMNKADFNHSVNYLKKLFQKA